MAFKLKKGLPRTSQISPSKVRALLRDTKLQNENPSLFQVLDNLLLLEEQNQAKLKETVTKSDPLNLSEQLIEGYLANKFGGSYSDKYTPTLSNTTNVTSSAAFECFYQVIGTTVNVFGTLEVRPTAAAQVELGISLPILSYFNNEGQCAGIASAKAISPENATIIADTTNFRATMDWIASFSGTTRKFWFNFSYQIIRET